MTADNWKRIQPDVRYDTTPSGALTVQDGIVAHAGGGKPGATELTANICRISAAADGDSVVLRAASAGDFVILINDVDVSVTIFADGSDTIDGNDVSGGLAIQNLMRMQFYSSADGNWSGMANSSQINGPP